MLVLHGLDPCLAAIRAQRFRTAQAKAAKQQLSKQRKASTAVRGKGSRPAPSRRGRGRGGVSLGVLLEEGLLLPGTGVLSVDYKQRRTLADLCGDGRIKCACARPCQSSHPKMMHIPALDVGVSDQSKMLSDQVAWRKRWACVAC